MVKIEEPVDSFLEIAAIQRRVYQKSGPALYFANVYDSRTETKCDFPMVSNIYGTMSRIEYIYRGAIEPLKNVMDWGVDPFAKLGSIVDKGPVWKTSLSILGSAFSFLKTSQYARPKFVREGAVMQNETTLDHLPQLISWPDDGGPFITLPLVYTENPGRPGVMQSNLGMYRVQIAGNKYAENQAGLHYQIHRGIAAHHSAAIRLGQPLGVNIFVGGAPAMTLAAVMPLPENVSELTFAGMLGQHRIPFVKSKNATGFNRLPIYAEADFCISGYLDMRQTATEGPFGDHLGYYSLQHEFPVLHVEKVYHRTGAIWPFTVVGRPPQEDSMFGKFIHELTGDMIPKKLPGIHCVRAVDEAGVHPLLLAIGSERYHPYDIAQQNRASELHTLAHSLLGFGQLSLAKYLFLAAAEDDSTLTLEHADRFLLHILRRVDWSRDLHFTTRTNTDTLDYSGDSLSRGSKLAVCVCGQPVRELPQSLDSSFENSISRATNAGFIEPKIIIPGVLAFVVADGIPVNKFAEIFDEHDPINGFPMIVLVDKRAKLNTVSDFLWTVFTKSDPARDMYGIGSFNESKHWGCRGSLIVDATTKPHHAPELIEDAQIAAKADKIADSVGKSVPNAEVVL